MAWLILFKVSLIWLLKKVNLFRTHCHHKYKFTEQNKLSGSFLSLRSAFDFLKKPEVRMEERLLFPLIKFKVFQFPERNSFYLWDSRWILINKIHILLRDSSLIHLGIISSAIILSFESGNEWYITT